jgi:lipopolysaccharide assembly protein A
VRAGRVIEVMSMTVEPPDRGEPNLPPVAPPTEVPPTEVPPAEVPPAELPPAAPVDVADRGVPRTRWGAAWVGVCAAALAAVALIVFMLQNTRSVQVTFLWMHGSLPLALGLLIAAVGAVLVAMVIGVARITQLRRLARRRRG